MLKVFGLIPGGAKRRGARGRARTGERSPSPALSQLGLQARTVLQTPNLPLLNTKKVHERKLFTLEGLEFKIDTHIQYTGTVKYRK